MDTQGGSKELYGPSWGGSLELRFRRLRRARGGPIWEMHCDAFRQALGASLEMHCGRVRAPVEAPGEGHSGAIGKWRFEERGGGRILGVVMAGDGKTTYIYIYIYI